ncbi:phage protein [Aeromonas salmonicida]|nr:phage protein [Aeromonas salmonicida]
MSAPLIRDPKYIDLLVVNGAWQLDAGGQPRYTQDRHSIGQDIKHRIMESGSPASSSASAARPCAAT